MWSLCLGSSQTRAESLTRVGETEYNFTRCEKHGDNILDSEIHRLVELVFGS